MTVDTAEIVGWGVVGFLLGWLVSAAARMTARKYMDEEHEKEPEEIDHFWSEWTIVPGGAERKCFYCDLVEKVEQTYEKYTSSHNAFRIGDCPCPSCTLNLPSK